VSGLWFGALTAWLTGSPPPLSPLFEPPDRTYAYAPCLVQGTHADERRLFYCANTVPGDVTDHICCRRGQRSGDGWHWGEPTVALSPSPERGAWDSRHVCDPEVLQGRYRWGGRAYSFALFYLGTDAEGSTHNQVGVAFADSLEGPWVKYGEPLVRYTPAEERPIGEAGGWPVYRNWGVGQPAATPVDGQGRVLLFYSRADTQRGEEVVELDLSDLDQRVLAGAPQRVPGDGLAAKGPLASIAVAYDPSRDRFVMVREGDRPAADGRFPAFVSSSVQVATTPMSTMASGEGRWSVVANIGPEATGWARNHNAGLLRTLDGRLPDPDRLTVVVSTAETYDTAPPDFGWLWTYRICTVEVALPPEPTPPPAPR
jgi:hypothetical protein